MATKEDLLFNGKFSDVSSSNENNQYSNLDLNQSHKCLSLNPEQSKSVSNDNSRKVNDLTQNERNNHNNTWNKEIEKDLKPFQYLTLHDYYEEKAQKQRRKKSKSTNSSTLSLHITAYENSTEVTADSEGSEKDSLKREGEKTNLSERGGPSKEVSNGPSSYNKNPFEFPRQQEDDQGSSRPEIMQFKASQRLRNFNEENSSDDDNVFAATPVPRNRHPVRQDILQQQQPGPSHTMKRNVSAGSSISVTQADTRRFYCIVSKDYENLTELQEQQLNKAYMLLKQHGAKAAITSVNKVMETKTRFAGFSYIIPEFSGELYEHLKSLEARIYGPLAIIQSLKKNGKIAKYSKPLLAMYCVGFNVTVTGLTVDERADIYEKIETLGGITSGTLTQKTTHLIARICDPYSDKYVKAARDKIPIISPNWVYYAYGAAEEGTVSMSNEIPIDDYVIGIFTGCNMTPSGFNGEQRLKISKLIQEYGGTFSGSMVQNKCTHLIIDSNTGEKYRKAVEWENVRIVTLRWLIKCTERGIRLREDDYRPGIKTSTQTDLNKTLEAPDVSNVYSSTSKKSRKPPPPSSVSSSNASIVAGDHTMMNPHPNATATAVIGSQTTPLKLPFSTSAKRNPSFAHSSHVAAKTNDPVMDFDASFFDDYGEYLKDCRLFFFEVTDEQKRTYRKIANRTGCTIPDSLSSATHILVPPRSYFPHQLSQLKDAVERAVEVVTSEWLIECVQQQRNIDPELFAFNFPRDRNLRNSKTFGLQKKRDSSLDKEFEVPSHVLDEINPECDLSSMHNTRSFEGRNDDEVDDDTIQNDEQEEEEMLDFDCHNVCEENLQEEQTEDFNNVDAEDVEQEDQTQNVENGSAGEIEDQMQNAEDIEQEQQMQDVNDGEREDQTEAFNNGNVVQDENIPRPSNVMDNNVDCLNLSMPINEYLRNDRPVKLHLPYDQLNAAISDDSELDSPTIDVLKLKNALAQMVQNIATPVGDAEPQIDSTVAQPKPLSPRKESAFEDPLQPELMEISEASKDVEEIPQQITVPVPVITMEEEDSFNKTRPLEERSKTSKDGEELPKENTADEEMPDEGTASGDGELPSENVVTVPDPIRLRKEKSFDAILPPELLKRCEAVTNCSNASFENGAEDNQSRKSVSSSSVEKRSNICDQLNFSNHEDKSQENTVDNDALPQEDDMDHGELPEENAVIEPDPINLRKEKSFDAILPPELLKRCEAVASRSPVSFEKDGDDENSRKSVPVITAIEKRSNISNRLSFSNEKDDESQREKSPAKVVWEGDYSTQDLVKLDAKYKNLKFIPSTQQLAPDDNFFDADSADPFQRLSNENLFVKPRVKKVVPQRRRLFGLEAESEEGTEDSGSVESAKVLAKVKKPKPKRKAPLSPVEKEPEPKRSKRNSNTTISVFDPTIVVQQSQQNASKDNDEKKKGESVVEQEQDDTTTSGRQKSDAKGKKKSQNTVDQKKDDAEIVAEPSNDATVPEQDQNDVIMAEEPLNDVTVAEQEQNHVSAEKEQNDLTIAEQQQLGDGGKENEIPENLLEQQKIDASIAEKQKKKEKKKPESPPPTYSNAHNVIFTNFTEQERKRLQEHVDAMRGNNLNETIEMSYADIVVCDKLQRSEKLMIALASGKYVVPSSYVIQSQRGRKWLPREEFEYGNPKSVRRRVDFSNVKDSVIAKKIFESCYRLRYKAESLQHGAFHGWKVLIFDNSPNSGSLVRIIEGGGGEAKLFKDVQHKEFKDFTMAIIASKSAGLFTDTEKGILNQYKIPYYTDQILSNYLLTPNTDEALKRSWHAGYRNFMQTKRK